MSAAPAQLYAHVTVFLSFHYFFRSEIYFELSMVFMEIGSHLIKASWLRAAWHAFCLSSAGFTKDSATQLRFKCLKAFPI